METVILCGGLGTRLREETEYRPKPMVHIGDRPILWHIMKTYSHYGFKDFILCLGYKGEVITDYFYHYDLMNNDITIELGKKKKICVNQRHEEEGWRITLVNTGLKAFKGARLKRVERYVTGDEFFMTYGDGVANINIKDLLAFHRNHGRVATVTGVHPTARFGELKTNGDTVQAFNEKPQTRSDLMNGGFFVFNKKIFDYLTTDDTCDLEIGPLEQLAAQGELMVYKHSGAWACMDTIRDMDFLNSLWAENKAFWAMWDRP